MYRNIYISEPPVAPTTTIPSRRSSLASNVVGTAGGGWGGTHQVNNPLTCHTYVNIFDAKIKPISNCN